MSPMTRVGRFIFAVAWPSLALPLLSGIAASESIENFEDCAKAGHPIAQSYPRQCWANGKNYIERISDVSQIAGTAVTRPVAVRRVKGLQPTQARPSRPMPPLEPVAEPELRYKLLDQFGNILFCDPDFYPIPRWKEKDLALAVFSEIQKAAGEFQAIIRHNRLTGIGNFSDHQKLLIYREHKKLRAVSLEPAGDNYKFSVLAARPQPGYEGKLGVRTEGFIDRKGNITVSKKEPPTPLLCPICLAADTLISTPQGPTPVQVLRKGMPIWTTDKSGRRRLGTVLNAAQTPTPPNHEMVRLILNDGRKLFASQGHPAADGRLIGDLSVGNPVDDGTISSIQRVHYAQEATYDVLPSGETGDYWANDILLKSTLFHKPR